MQSKWLGMSNPFTENQIVQGSESHTIVCYHISSYCHLKLKLNFPVNFLKSQKCYILNALLSIINSGPVVSPPTITELEFAIIPEDG